MQSACCLDATNYTLLLIYCIYELKFVLSYGIVVYSIIYQVFGAQT